MTTGTVKWFNAKKGYGFIFTSDNKEYFAHHTAIQGSGYRLLYPDQTVEFEIEESDKGPRAINIQPNEPPKNKAKTTNQTTSTEN